jgi:hypothetical protein
MQKDLIAALEASVKDALLNFAYHKNTTYRSQVALEVARRHKNYLDVINDSWIDDQTLDVGKPKTLGHFMREVEEENADDQLTFDWGNTPPPKTQTTPTSTNSNGG